MNALAIHLYLTIRYINLTFNYFGNFYRIIVYRKLGKTGVKVKQPSSLISTTWLFCGWCHQHHF